METIYVINSFETSKDYEELREIDRMGRLPYASGEQFSQYQKRLTDATTIVKRHLRSFEQLANCFGKEKITEFGEKAYMGADSWIKTWKWAADINGMSMYDLCMCEIDNNVNVKLAFMVDRNKFGSWADSARYTEIIMPVRYFLDSEKFMRGIRVDLAGLMRAAEEPMYKVAAADLKKWREVLDMVGTNVQTISHGDITDWENFATGPRKFKDLTEGMNIWTVMDMPEHAQHLKIIKYVIDKIHRQSDLTDFECSLTEPVGTGRKALISIVKKHENLSQVAGKLVVSYFTNYDEAIAYVKMKLQNG